MTYVPHPDRYATMPYRRLGRSGVKVSALTLGLYQNFTDNTPYGVCRDIVCRAFDRGITHFDLANNYGSPAGSAEAIFGRVLRSDLAAHRDELFIATKAGYDMWPGPYGEWGSRKYLLASLDQSLRRLGLPYVDVFYSHRFDPETPLEETMGALASAVRQGKALYVGISNYDPASTEKAVGILSGLGVPCLVHQTSYSLLNRRYEERLQAVLAEQGVGAVVFQPLQRGLLSSSYLGSVSPERRAKVRGWGMPEQWLDLLPPLDALARERGQSLAQMSIAWSLRDDRVASALVGVSSTAQLEDSLGALQRLAFSPDELTRIDGVLAGVPRR